MGDLDSCERPNVLYSFNLPPKKGKKNRNLVTYQIEDNKNENRFCFVANNLEGDINTMDKMVPEVIARSNAGQTQDIDNEELILRFTNLNCDMDDHPMEATCLYPYETEVLDEMPAKNKKFKKMVVSTFMGKATLIYPKSPKKVKINIKTSTCKKRAKQYKKWEEQQQQTCEFN